MKLLLLDIETAPNTAHVWGLYKQTVSIKQLMESSYVLCWTAKWLEEKEIIFRDIHAPDMLSLVYSLLNEADAVIRYNGTSFDIPTLNKEFILNNKVPPTPYKHIDLLNVVRKQFRFPSNKLDYICQRLGLGNKTRHEGHELWVKCMVDDEAAWARMKRYNIQDVKLLEKLYKRVLPWIWNHPNHGLHRTIERPVCPNCGSTRIKKNGVEPLVAYTYQRYKCSGCGANLRGSVTIDRKPNLLRGVK